MRVCATAAARPIISCRAHDTAGVAGRTRHRLDPPPARRRRIDPHPPRAGLNPLLGAGGWSLCVRVLVYICGEAPKAAVAESLAIVGVIAAIGALPYARKGL